MPPLQTKVTRPRRLKWPKKPQYAETLRAIVRKAGLSRKELAAQSGWSLGQIKRALSGDHISYQTHQAIDQVLQKRLGRSTGIAYPWPLLPPNERNLRDAETKFQGLMRVNLYDEASQLAEETTQWCWQSKCFFEAAHWADHAAGIYRSQGKLELAVKLLGRNSAAIKRAVGSDEKRFRLLLLRSRFEQTMTKDYFALGDFRAALRSYDALDSEADKLLKQRLPDLLKTEVLERKVHHRRQRAEMLRLLGQYNAALSLIREVAREYPAWADEAKRYSDLSEANCLRLLGEASRALEIYKRLEVTATKRHSYGFLGSVLWAKVGAIQILKNRPNLKRTLSDLHTLSENHAERFLYLFIYSRLVSVSSQLGTAGGASKLVDDAVECGPLKPDSFRTEYAHALLCRGEIARSRNCGKEARDFYHEALHYYKLMEMRWGIVRATIGLNLLGERLRMPAGLEIEGCDDTILKHYQKGGGFRDGVLCENIP